MTGYDDYSDEQLLSALRAAAAVTDPPPEEVVLAARSAIAYRSLDAQLAEIVSDSAAADEKILAGVRSGPRSRHVVFRAPAASLELELQIGATEVDLTGQIDPAGHPRLTVEHRSGAIEVDVSDAGDFVVPGCPRGPLRLRLARASGAAVATAWIVA